MLRLGHIVYSNCFPIHAGILTGKVAFPFAIVEGIPTELNRYLVEGKIDVSPSSSIEYAMNPGKYRILPGLSITSRNKVMSILLESKVPLEDLDGKTVALTTASATSVVLLRVILELFTGVCPDFLQYEQGSEDPYVQADAVLTIGDLAIQRAASPRFPHAYDLGEVWHRQTGLPFVFALWQVNYRRSMDQDLARLSNILKESKEYGLSRLNELAEGHAAQFGIPVETLVRYWNCFSYDLGPEEQKGLLAYYGYAMELGVIDSVPGLKIWTPDAAR
ncbi:MAG: menaquinone biosynthesis protein [Nitrospirota bacterium]